jgi:hypothetical protein
MATRDTLHRLVDELPESEVPAAERFLEYLSVARSDPFLQALLRVPLDDGSESSDEQAAAAEGRAALEQGDLVSHEQIRRELGL